METVSQSDEFHHDPVPGKNWQENYVFHAWDPARNSGWFIHLGHIFDEGLIDVRVSTIIDGEVTSATVQAPGADCLAAPGVDVKAVVPLERLKIRYSGSGARGPDDDGFFGERKGDVPFGFDIEMISEHPAVTWTEVTRKLNMDPLRSGTRYEQGARWKGRLWSGDQVIEAEGLLVRDHSWGPRAWHDRGVGGFWTPMVFDGGRKFISGVMITEGCFQSFTILADQTGVINTSYDNWVRIDNGALIARRFRRAQFLRLLDDRMERYDYEGHIHLVSARHASFMDKSAKFGRSDMYSTIRTENSVGFGTLQHRTRNDVSREGLANPVDMRTEPL